MEACIADNEIFVAFWVFIATMALMYLATRIFRMTDSGGEDDLDKDNDIT